MLLNQKLEVSSCFRAMLSITSWETIRAVRCCILKVIKNVNRLRDVSTKRHSKAISFTFSNEFFC
ncbi:unnamed protein product [Oikopleura dioica]|uniref:Uncharacterized protein n=1 Tax=Oikopleura dioica TaxID=34765 RepID=E4YRW9_OIKDI|nr:unnamed protein product [Oikopleura dioica]